MNLILFFRNSALSKCKTLRIGKLTSRGHFALAMVAVEMLKKVLRVLAVSLVSVKRMTNQTTCDTTVMHFSAHHN